MGVIITSNPTRNVNGNAGLQSRWSSVHQPILFGACRQDHPVVNVKLIGGAWYVLLPSIPSGLIVGGQLWLKSQTNDLLVSVVSISGLLVRVSAVTGSFTVNTVGGYVNLISARKNYYVEIVCYAVDDSNTYYRTGSQDVKPSPDGAFTFDLHGYLKSEARMGDTFNYAVINKKFSRSGSRYNFTFQEKWLGSSTVPSALGANTTYYWVNGAKQLQERYNFNVAEYVPFITIDTAKFLSDFVKPTYFPGFPFSLSFIWSDKVAGRQLQRIEDNFTTTTTDNLDPAQTRAVNMMRLKGSYASSVNEIDVWLNDAGIATMHFASPLYVDPRIVGLIPFDSPVKKL